MLNYTPHTSPQGFGQNNPRFSTLIYILILVALFVLPALARAQGQSGPQVLQYIQEGDYHIRLLNWEEAEMAYTNALQTDVSSAAAYMKRAVLYKMQGRYQESLKDYNRALALNPYSEYIYDKRSALKMLAMDYEGALEDINEAISINPQDEELQERRVDEFIEMGEYELALQDLDTLIERGYRPQTELEKKALVQLLMGNNADSRYTIEQALANHDHSSLTYDLLGILELKDQRYGRAVEAFSKAIELNPEFSLAYYNRAIAYRYLGNPEAALQDLNTSIKLNQEEGSIYFKRALVRKELGDVRGALDDYNKAVGADSTYSDALYNRAYTLKYLGDYSNALRDAEQIVMLEPESAKHWNLKGNILLLFGEKRQAIDAYSNAIDQDYDFIEAHYNRGLAYLMSAQPIQGCQDLRYSLDVGYEQARKAYKNFCGN